MLTYCLGVWNEFVNFIGGRSGLAHWLLFGLAVFCCIFMGKEIRRKIFWPAVLVLLVFFNPLFYAVVGTRFLSGVYWRLLWMMPISFIIAYALTQVTFRIRKRMLRIGAVVLAVVCIISTGSPVFSAATYSEKENDYELPNAVIEVCDVIANHATEWKETAVVPNEMLCYVRQYSCAVCLFYGRNAGGFITNIEPDEEAVYAEMSKENPDLAVITEITKRRGCDFLVFNTSFHKIPEDLTQYGYQFVDVVEDIYAIYQLTEDAAT